MQKRCRQEIFVKLPFRVEKEKILEICISDLEMGIPDTSSIELFLPFGDDYETFTQIITLENLTAEVHYILQYPSGQTFVDYCFDRNGKLTRTTKVYYRNGRLKHQALYLQLSDKEYNRLGRSPFDESKKYTPAGKISIDYSFNKCPEKYGNCNNFIKQYFYNNKGNLSAVQSFFYKDSEHGEETIHFYQNGDIRKKTLRKSYKLHGWQELYNESGKLIAKEKFEEGESVEFIKN